MEPVPAARWEGWEAVERAGEAQDAVADGSREDSEHDALNGALRGFSFGGLCLFHYDRFAPGLRR